MKPIQSALAAGVALTLLTGGPTVAQSSPTPRPPAARPPAAAAAPAAPAAQSPVAPAASAAPATSAPPVQGQPVRTETTTFSNWTVTCREVGGAPKRTCSAVLQALDQNRRLVMTWIFGHTPEGALTTVLRTPTGVLLQRGVELKVGDAAPRKLTYVNCDNQQCEATIPMDNAFVQDASGAQTAAAVIVAKTGQTITINLPIAGFDKAVAAVVKG